MQRFPGLGFGGLWWCGWWNRPLNTWVLGVPKKLKYARPVSFLGDLLIYSAWFMVFQTFPPFKRCVKFRENSPKFFEAAMNKTPMKKTDVDHYRDDLGPGFLETKHPRYNHDHQNQYILRIFLRLRHPKLSSLSTASWEIILWWVFPMDVVHLCMHDHIFELSA